jgi:hypothetical protein
MPRARPSSKADIAARRAASRLFSAETVAAAIDPRGIDARDLEALRNLIAESVGAETVAVPIGGSLPDIADVPGASAAEAAAVEALLDRIEEIAHVGEPQRPRFRAEVRVLLWRHEVEKRQNQQEHPKREIAAYKLVQADARRLLKRLLPPSKRRRERLRAAARRLLTRLRHLPEGVRLPLRAGNTETRLGELIGASATRFAAAIDNAETQLEELAGNAKIVLAALRRRAAPDRLANPASAQLRGGLLKVFAPYIPDARKRDRRVTEVLRLLGVRYPNEKKNRGRFRGRERQT